MSTEIQTAAKEPKRERGKQRVAALIDAGAELFAEKGYEATTMTEIASRAGAAIGSLYQFFPVQGGAGRGAIQSVRGAVRPRPLLRSRRARRDVRRASSLTSSSTISSGRGRIGTRRSRSRAGSPASSSAGNRSAMRCADGSPRSSSPATRRSARMRRRAIIVTGHEDDPGARVDGRRGRRRLSAKPKLLAFIRG